MHLLAKHLFKVEQREKYHKGSYLTKLLYGLKKVYE